MIWYVSYSSTRFSLCQFVFQKVLVGYCLYVACWFSHMGDTLINTPPPHKHKQLLTFQSPITPLVLMIRAGGSGCFDVSDMNHPTAAALSSILGRLLWDLRKGLPLHTYTHNTWKHSCPRAVKLLEEALVSLLSLIKCLCLSDILGIQTVWE